MRGRHRGRKKIHRCRKRYPILQHCRRTHQRSRKARQIKLRVTMNIDITIEEAYARASEGLQKKMEYSISLLQRAEKLALAYDNRGGIFLLSVEAKTVRPFTILHSWPVYASRDT